MTKMTDDELRSAVDHEVAESASWTATNMADDLERNLNYYHGRPMGNEVPGRSQVVSWDVFEVIESAVPSLLEPFFAGDDIGEFEPQGPEDEEYAEQATEYTNYLIKKNDGFILFNTWIKDALLSKVGIVRTWWDATRKIKKESYQGLTEQQLTKMANDPKITIVSADATPDPDDMMQRQQVEQELPTMPPEQQQEIMGMLSEPPKMLYDIEITVDSGPRGIRSDNVTPESFILSRRAKKMEDVTIIGELRQYTRSDLVEMGFDRKRVDNLSDYQANGLENDMLSERDEDRLNTIDSDPGEGALQQLTLFFGFMRVDYDGDGIAEWRRLLMGGNDILENEEVDDHDYSLFSPILLPHRIIGMALADPIISIQDQKTSLTRQYLDSLYIANTPTTYALPGANLDDLLSTRIGKVVRMKNLGDAGPLQTTLVANESLQGIELMNTVREERVGITRQNQGLDADSLNKTATGAKIADNRDQRRILMMLRIFAETGAKDLFRRYLKLMCEYQDKPATIRLRNKWVEYDPRNWSSEMDVNINVGLGTGDKTKTVQFLQMMGAYFQQAAPLGIVSPENVYNLGKILLKAGDIQGGETKLLTDPANIPPKEPTKSPEQVIAESTIEVENIKQQGKREEAMMKLQFEQEKLQAQTILKEMDLQIADKQVRIKEIELGLKQLELEHTMRNDAVNQIQQHNAAQVAAEQNFYAQDDQQP